MGNQISKCCERTDPVHSKNNEIEIKTQKVKSKYLQKHAATKIQSMYRKFIAISKLKNLISSIEKDYFQNIGRNVDDDEIKNRRGKILSKIEEDFKEFHPEGIRMNNYFDENKNEKHSLFKKIFKTVHVNSTNEIFQGYFVLNNLSDDKYVYQRDGYGCLYLYDGTKIEGIWSGDLIINDGIIFHNNGKIYIGEIAKIYENEILKYKEHGRGCLYYFKDKVVKQTISGTWNNGILVGQSVINNIGRFVIRCQMINGNINYDAGIFDYVDGVHYEGQFDFHFHKNGYGKITYPNGECYEGYWKKDKYHGEGVLFKPESTLTSRDIDEEYKHKEISGKLNSKGSMIKATWIEGLLHGKGTITYDHKTAENFWRFGKLIQSVSLLEKSRHISLNENILNFLSFEEKIALLKLKNKKINSSLFKDSNKFALALTFYKMGSSDISNYPILDRKQHKKSEIPLYFNKYLFSQILNITNTSDIIENFSKKCTNFIPIVGFYTNGGFVQKRLHYSNIFNPDLKKAYSSNYLFQKKNDVVINGAINELMKITNKETSSYNPYKDTDDDDVLTKTLLEKSKKFIAQYEEISKEYKYDLNKMILYDKNIIDKYLNVTEGISFFTIDKIIIDCPIKLSLYTILGNPVKTIAIYIHDKEPGNIDHHLLNSNFINGFNPIDKKENFDNLLNNLKSSYFPIKINDNTDHLSIEFDTQEQFVRNPTEMQLLSLIILKDYSKPHLISFKKYYHAGKFLSIKLIDQSTIYNYEKAGIDIGSILFYGEIFKIRN